MNRGLNKAWYKALTGLMWLAPMWIALRYWRLWDRLPLRMATHFNAAGRANGWMPREESLYYTLGFLGFLLVVFSAVLYLVQRKYELTKLSWALVAFLNIEIWTVAYTLNAGLNYNVGVPFSITPFLVVTPVGALVIVALAVMEKRGTAFSTSEVLAEEVQAGKTWGLVFLVPALVVIVAAVLLPNAVLRVTLALTAILMAGAFAMAWDGFHYLFTRHGVEIRTLGFRLKSIPLMQIKNYAIANWNPLRGYGIRGIGNHKAYVWGKTGVRVEMYDGEIFLGHGDPQRIVHDLNVIKRYQHS